MRIQQWGMVLLLSGSAVSFAQVTANGNCNVAAGNMSGGNITIPCGSLTPAETKALIKSVNEVSARLKQREKNDFSLGVVQGFLATIKKKEIPIEKWPETFGEITREYFGLGEGIKNITPTSDAVKRLVERAEEARKKGDLPLTSSLLQQAIELSSQDDDKKQKEAQASGRQTALLLALRASAAFTQLERFQGAELLEKAFDRVKNDPDSDAIAWLLIAGDKVAEGGKSSEALRLYTKAQRAAQRSAEDNQSATRPLG